MANTLLIHKTGTGKFWHTHNGDFLSKFALSKFDVSLDGSNFNIVQKNGATRFTYLVQNITIQVLNGAIETFNDPQVFYDRLIEIKYTPFYSGEFSELNDSINNIIPLKSKFILVHKITDNPNLDIEMGDFAKGFGAGAGTDLEYWILAKYLNLTSDNNTNNYLNYKPITVSLPNS